METKIIFVAKCKSIKIMATAVIWDNHSIQNAIFHQYLTNTILYSVNDKTSIIIQSKISSCVIYTQQAIHLLTMAKNSLSWVAIVKKLSRYGRKDTKAWVMILVFWGNKISNFNGAVVWVHSYTKQNSKFSTVKLSRVR